MLTRIEVSPMREAERRFLYATANLLLETLVWMPSGPEADQVARQWHHILGLARTW